MFHYSFDSVLIFNPLILMEMIPNFFRPDAENEPDRSSTRDLFFRLSLIVVSRTHFHREGVQLTRKAYGGIKHLRAKRHRFLAVDRLQCYAISNQRKFLLNY
jgi:hypothetical protein